MATNVKTLYDTAMGMILTQGRHYGNIFVAVHSPD